MDSENHNDSSNQREIRNNTVEAMDTEEVTSSPNEVFQPVLPHEILDQQTDNLTEPTMPMIPTTVNENSSEVNDVQMEDEEMRSEATFSFVVQDFSKMKDSILSPPCYVRNLPWKIMVMQRTSNSGDRGQDTRSMGFFLQCNAESDSSSWSCNAKAELKLMSHKPDQEPFVRQIKHLFYSKENDWGFSHFMHWNEILDPERGYIQDDKIILEVHVVAEAPHGVFWDSKKHTGFVGLKNQGATCYMNSLLQTLYFTNQLRKAVYKMPTEADDSTKSVALALQRVFYDLQFCDKPVGTKKLTKSFGWETLDSFMQHDVQEFLRVLLDKVESKMKRTCAEGTVPSLFEGKMSSYIKCKNVNYTSTRTETFYDIQLNIKGKKNIYESFKDYIAKETLEGDNKYDAGEHGLQDAEKGVIFVKFPPVLHLHLMRFQYDPITDNSVKFNDRFEFYEQINLDQYLQSPEDTPADYILHAVLVHSGDNHGGHYVVYINPYGDGKWCKFDDDVVSKCNKAEAIEHNYGGVDDELSLNAKHCSNAYMLVYIRKSAMPQVLQEIKESDIPSELIDRLAEERRMEQVRRRERSEANTYITINVLLEEYFEGHQTTDLFDLEKVHCRSFKMKKTQTIADLMNTFKDAFYTPISHMRLWPLVSRHNQLTRPSFFHYKDDQNKSIIQCAELQNPWLVFLELLPPDSILTTLSSFNTERNVLLFFKFYDPAMKRLNYCGLGYYNKTQKVSELVPDLNRRVGWPNETELTLYEEHGTNMAQKITNLNETLEKLELIDGDDVIIFEKKHCDDNLELATCEDYFKDLLYRVEVVFIDKTSTNDAGFTLELSQRMSYEQMANAVGQKMNVDPNTIQFFRCQNYKELPGNPIKSAYEGPLKDFLIYNKPKSVKKLFYQILPMNINELENKKQFKCFWLPPNMKEEKELVLYPNKNGTVKTLIEEAAKHVEFSEDGTRQLRMVTIQGCKIGPGPREDTELEHLHQHSDQNASQQICYRFEEIPQSELNLAEDEMLIPVSHFYKSVHELFGIPFFVKVKQGEPFCQLKTRIQNKLGVPDKEWEKYKFALIMMGRSEYINDDDVVINLSDFKNNSNNQRGTPMSFLGLEHVNKTQRRSRFNYLEKAIKIYN